MRKHINSNEINFIANRHTQKQTRTRGMACQPLLQDLLRTRARAASKLPGRQASCPGGKQAAPAASKLPRRQASCPGGKQAAPAASVPRRKRPRRQACPGGKRAPAASVQGTCCTRASCSDRICGCPRVAAGPHSISKDCAACRSIF
jgi:hypothetical protein